MPSRLLAALILCFAAFAQTPPAFDAAEIKPVKPAGDARVSGDFLHGRVTVHNATLHMLINTAYSVRFDLITGGPKWIDTDWFDVAAVAPPDTTESASRLMLRTLLEESFRLAVHHEQKEAAVYALTVAKSGTKLKPAAQDSPERPGCRYSPLGCHKVSMPDLAAMLPNLGRNVIDRPVVDLTGIEGRYDFTLAFGGDSGRSIFEALADVGLRLEPGKHAIDYLVVDRADRLTADSGRM